jgi:hypothetical protein
LLPIKQLSESAEEQSFLPKDKSFRLAVSYLRGSLLLIELQKFKNFWGNYVGFIFTTLAIFISFLGWHIGQET